MNVLFMLCYELPVTQIIQIFISRDNTFMTLCISNRRAGIVTSTVVGGEMRSPPVWSTAGPPDEAGSRPGPGSGTHYNHHIWSGHYDLTRGAKRAIKAL